MKLLKSPAMYALLGRGVQMATQVALLLIIPKVLTSETYVQFSLVLPLAFLGATLAFGWLSGAIYRHVYELIGVAPEYRQSVFAYYAMGCILALFIQFVIFLVVTSSYAVVPLLLIATALKTGILGVANAAERGKQFLIFNLGFAVSTTVFIVMCWSTDGDSLDRNLLIYAALDLLVAIWAWSAMKIFSLTPLPRIHANVLSRYFTYGYPLVINSVAVWVISMSDRYLLSIWESTDNVASYILSYQLSGSIITIPMAFAMAVIFPRVIRIDREAGTDAALAHVYRLLKAYTRYMLIMLMFGCGIVLGVMYFIYPAYALYPHVIAIIVLAHVILGLSHFFNKEFELNGRTMVITKGVGIGALANVLLNLVLIPAFGVLGAALATLLAYSISVYVIYSSSTRLLRIG